MPWKLIIFLVCLVLLAFFIGFNLENACNVNFGFKQFDNVPVFLTALFSFVAGILATLPFTFGKWKNKTAKAAPSVRTSVPAKPSTLKPSRSSETSAESILPVADVPSEQAKSE